MFHLLELDVDVGVFLEGRQRMIYIGLHAS